MDEKPTRDLGITLYNLNKQAMSKEQPLDVIAFNNIISKVADKVKDKEYWMLLCNERKDYTVFKIEHPNNRRTITEELSVTINNRGQVLSIDEQEDGNFEIWIKDYNTKEAFAYYLFDYTFGVVKV